MVFGFDSIGCDVGGSQGFRKGCLFFEQRAANRYADLGFGVRSEREQDADRRGDARDDVVGNCAVVASGKNDDELIAAEATSTRGNAKRSTRF